MTALADYDRLWKEIITELFEEFLLFFSPDLYEQVDFSTSPISLEQELHKISPKAKSKNRRSDKLINVRLKNGEEQWVLVHIEIQGTSDEDFPKRMFQYFYRVLDRYDQQLYTIALYTDEREAFKPNCYDYSFFGTTLIYTFNTYKILEQEEEELLHSHNPFALAVLAGLYMLKSRKQDQKYYKAKLFKLLLTDKKIPKGKIRPLLIFIDHLIELPEKDTEQLVQEISPLIEKEDKGMGLSLDDTSIAQYYKKIGMEKGRKEGIKETAQRMLKEGISIEIVVKVTGLTEEEIKKLN